MLAQAFTVLMCVSLYSGGHIRLLRGQGGRAVVPGVGGDLRAEEERRRLVGGRHGWCHWPLPRELRRALRLVARLAS